MVQRLTLKFELYCSVLDLEADMNYVPTRVAGPNGSRSPLSVYRLNHGRRTDTTTYCLRLKVSAYE